MEIFTTLKRIKAYSPCEEGYQDLITHLDEDYPLSKRIYATDMIRAGVKLKNVLWGLQTISKGQKQLLEKPLRLFACDCAEHVLPLFEKVLPDDKRPHMAIEAARQFACGTLSAEELLTARDAAGDATWAAARDAAGDAAWAAAWAAARDAAGDAAWAAAGAAARAAGDAEETWQRGRLLYYLEIK